MKKLIIALALLTLPAMASACTYDHIKVDSDGTMHGRWIPCNNPECPDYQKHVKMIQNQRIVYEHDVSKDKHDVSENKADSVKNDRYVKFDGAKKCDKQATRNSKKKHAKKKVRADVDEHAKDKVREDEGKHDKVHEGTKKDKNCSDAGKFYDRKEHRVRDVEAAVAEQDAINKLTGPLPEGTIVEKKRK